MRCSARSIGQDAIGHGKSRGLGKAGFGNTADTDHNQISRKPFRIGMQQKFTFERCDGAYLSVEM